MAGNNMTLWDAVCVTDPERTKRMTFGAKLTQVDAMDRIMRVTEQLGECGVGWGYEVRNSIERLGEIQVLAISDVTLWIRDRMNTFGPIRGVNQLVNDSKYLDEDAWKKATTDALGKLLSHIGVSADVYLGKFDDPAYVKQREAEVKREKATQLFANTISMLNTRLNSVIGCKSDEDRDLVCSWATGLPCSYEDVIHPGSDGPNKVLNGLSQKDKVEKIAWCDMLPTAKRELNGKVKA